MSEKIFEPFDPIFFGWNTLKSNLQFFTVLMVIVAGLYYVLPLVQMIFISEVVSPQVISLHLIALLGLYYIIPPIQMMFLSEIMSPYQAFSLHLIAIVSGIFYLIIYQVVELGLVTIALEFHDGIAHNIEDLFKNYRLFPNFLIATIIYGLMVAIGFILFIIPGIYLALKYLFYGYLIVDRGLGPIQALRESGRMTNGAKKYIIVYWLTLWCGIAVITIIMGIFIAVGIVFTAISRELAISFFIFVNLISFVINLLIIVPIAKLSMADVYRILEARSSAASLSEGDQEDAENMPEA